MTQERKTSGVEAAFGLFFSVPVLTLWGGYVLWKLWHWFAVPFLSAPVLPMAAVIGLSMLKSLLLYRRDYKAEAKSLYEQFFHIFGAYSFALLIGWLASLAL